MSAAQINLHLSPLDELSEDVMRAQRMRGDILATATLACFLTQIGAASPQEASAIFPTGVIYQNTRYTNAVVPQKLDVPGVPTDKHGTYERHPYYIFVEDPNTQIKYLVSDGQLKAELTLVPGSEGTRPKASGDGVWLVAKYAIDVKRSGAAAEGLANPVLSINDPACAEESCFFVTGTGSFRDLPSSFDQFNSYVVPQPEPPSTDQARLPWGSVFTPKPGTPLYYMYICWDVSKLDYMDYQNTQCINPLLALPDKDSRDYRGMGGGMYLPYGWQYDSVVHSNKESFTSLLSTSRDVMNGLQRTTGYNVSGSVEANLGIASAEASFSFKSSHGQMKKFENMHENKTVFTRSQYSHTSYALVVDKINGALDPGFRAAVATMLPQLKAGNLNDRTVIDFVKDWGTHYPYAVTYGTQGSATFTLTESEVKALIERGVNYSQAWEGNVKVSVLGSGGSIGGGSSSETAKQMNSAFSSIMSASSEVYVCSGGATCDGGEPKGEPIVPIFLDLRPISELLAPPYYDDPEVVLYLRDRVLAAIKEYAFIDLQDSGPALDVVQLEFHEPECNGVPCTQSIPGSSWTWVPTTVSKAAFGTFLRVANITDPGGHLVDSDGRPALSLDYAGGKPSALFVSKGDVSFSGFLSYDFTPAKGLGQTSTVPLEEFTLPSQGGQIVWRPTSSFRSIEVGHPPEEILFTIPVTATKPDLAKLLGVLGVR